MASSAAAADRDVTVTAWLKMGEDETSVDVTVAASAVVKTVKKKIVSEAGPCGLSVLAFVLERRLSGNKVKRLKDLDTICDDTETTGIVEVNIVPLAAGGAGGPVGGVEGGASFGGSASSEWGAAVADLSRALAKSVSFETPFTAVHYDDPYREYKLRPVATYAGLISRLQRACNFDPSAGGLCYFRNNDISGDWASGRKRLADENSFKEWIALEEDEMELPRVVMYRRVDGKSPEKGPPSDKHGSPSRASAGTPSTVSSGSGRRSQQTRFRDELRELDRAGCVIPTCTVSFATSFAQAEAAHIIPSSILTVPAQHDFYKEVMGAAGFTSYDIDRPCNGMLLCTSHHTTFDKYQWTVSGPDFELVVRDDADADQKVFHGKKLDLSHRTGKYSLLSKEVWVAYNKFIFADKGHQLGLCSAKKKGRKKKPGRKPRGGAGAPDDDEDADADAAIED